MGRVLAMCQCFAISRMWIRFTALSPSRGSGSARRSKEHSELMGTPQLTPDQIAEVSALVAEYITEQREKALPHAVPPSPA